MPSGQNMQVEPFKRAFKSPAARVTTSETRKTKGRDNDQKHRIWLGNGQRKNFCRGQRVVVKANLIDQSIDHEDCEQKLGNLKKKFGIKLQQKLEQQYQKLKDKPKKLRA